MIFFMMPGGWGELNSLQYAAHFGLGSNPPPPALKVNAAATKKFNCNLQRASLKETPGARGCCQEYTSPAFNLKKNYRLYFSEYENLFL